MVTSKLMTIEDFERITEAGRYDLIRGELIAMAPAGEEHGSLAFTLSTLLGPHIRRGKLGRGYTAETGFVLQRDPDVVLVPDVAFVRAERLPATELRPKFFEGPPDLAVEVVSPSESSTHVDGLPCRSLRAAAAGGRFARR